MFNGQEKKRIEELDAEVEEALIDNDRLKEAHAEEVAALKAAHAAELANLRSQYAEAGAIARQVNQDERLRKEAKYDQESAAKDRAIAVLEGRLEESEQAARRWWQLANGWRFHKGGSKEVEGIVYTLYEARTDDPTINIRILIPEGVSFP